MTQVTAADGKQVKHTRGYGFRIAYAVFLLCCSLVFLAMGTILFLPELLYDLSDPEYQEYVTEDTLLLLSMLIPCAFCILTTILQFVSAAKGRVKKSWNTLSIVLGAILSPTLFGIFGIIGGVRGNQAIDHPELYDNRVSDGYACRVFFAVFWLLGALALLATGISIFLIELFDFYACADADSAQYVMETLYEIFIPFVASGTFCLIASILQFISARKGKKKKGWNTLSIVLGSIFAPTLFGIFGIVGGVQGNNFLLGKKPKAKKEKRTKAVREQSAQTVDTSGETGTVAIEEKAPAQYIQPKMSLKGKKAITWTLVASYSLFLVVGILLSAIPALSKMLSAIGLCQESGARAYAVTIGVMWVALVPTIGYFFATISPYELQKKNKILVAALTTALLVATNVMFFIIINAVKIDGLAVKKFFEDDDTWFVPLSMVFGSVASMVCYALTLCKLNPDKIKTRKPQMPQGHNLLAMLTHVFKMIGYGVLSLTKKILAFKEKQPDIFILVASVLLTWLSFFTAFVFAVICIVILVAVVIMYFAGVISLASYNESQPVVKADEVLSAAKAYTYTDSHGYEQTIYSDNQTDFYDAGGHYVASSHDSGKTVTFAAPRHPDEEQEEKDE